ncbi:5-hydroxytryptamine receptor 1B-like [Paramacrobiotus metropolitanus]|uniref:5-hydroxytryptamine receptor 1B-like n=1 Tax=Paramacrobiotus metropolitanus TaxID=2943436 RepID=UPI0024462F06|nr:5-hydroxytryptamine receptor 1B-like [Paramacrobiotus metropolitanus]
MSNSNFSNLTNTSSFSFLYALSPAPNWTIIIGLKAFIGVASFILNGAILLLHILRPTLINPFTIYLLFLFTANVCFLMIIAPLGTISNLYGGEWFWGHPVCVFYIYAQRIVTVIHVMSHLLISFNRLWAVTYPISYRERHTKRTAVLIYLGMLGYVHIISLPPFLVETIRYQRSDADKGCHHIAMPAWSRAQTIIHRLMPLSLVISIYVFLIVKRWQKKRRSAVCVGAVEELPVASGNTTGTVGQTNTGKHEESRMTSSGKPIGSGGQRQVRPFVILTITTISVVTCWLPEDVFWIAVVFCNVWFSSAVFQFTEILYFLQMVFDPLMWIASLRRTKA